MKTYVTEDGRTLRILEAAEDVTDADLDAAVRTLDWFEDEPRMPSTEDFIDALCKREASDFDIELLDCPAVRKIMRHARQARREV